MAYKLSEISTGLTATFKLPASVGTKTVTVNGVAATITSEGYNFVTISAIPPAGNDVVITVQDKDASQLFVSSPLAPVNADGRPDGTIYFQTV